jgi:hypothetical protein
MSPGLLALGPGMFSVSGVNTTRLMLQIRKLVVKRMQKAIVLETHGNFSLAMASADETTVAAPPGHGSS